jgi:surfeit locus 1 family protein
VALVLAAVFVRLGVWQLDRREERRAFNASRAAALARPPLLLGGNVPAGAGRAIGAASASAAPDSAAAVHRRAVATGVFDLSRERVVGQRSWRGSPGVGLLAPLLLEGGGEVWVDRGWAPAPDAATLDPAPYAERGRVRVEGFFRPPTSRERLALARAAGGSHADRGAERSAGTPHTAPALVLQQLPGPGAVLRRLPPPEPDDGPHLSYAIQWFAFAAIALVGTGAWLAAQRRASARPTPSSRPVRSGPPRPSGGAASRAAAPATRDR